MLLKQRDIAKPIPMKRELKQMDIASDVSTARAYCKAYPDEKGIETMLSL